MILFNRYITDFLYKFTLYLTDKMELKEVFFFKVDHSNRNSMFFLTRTFTIFFGIFLASFSFYKYIMLGWEIFYNKISYKKEKNPIFQQIYKLINALKYMRKEIENWWKQSKEDLDSAEYIFKGKKYYLVTFLCHQSIEKGLKALILHNTKEQKIEGHSLIFLSKKANLPEEFITKIRKINPHYSLSRYPDLTEDAPFELYDEEISKEHLYIAKEVIKWIELQIK